MHGPVVLQIAPVPLSIRTIIKESVIIIFSQALTLLWGYRCVALLYVWLAIQQEDENFKSFAALIPTNYTNISII